VETFVSPIPLYDGMKPYQQTAFQYSLHVLEADGELCHYEFLAEPGIDPRESFLESLLANMPTVGSVVAYNKSFERGILENLAKIFPKEAKSLNEWIYNLVDLMVPFRQRDVYFWQMKGSYSIKYVLPALCPHLSYRDFAVSNGFAAMEAYWAMCEAKDAETLNLLRASLLEYCGLDTFGMVEIVAALRELTKIGIDQNAAINILRAGQTQVCQAKAA
jgi:hypothetical protein